MNMYVPSIVLSNKVSLISTEMSGMCDLSPDTPIYSWWGRISSRLTAIGQCRVDNFPAGLHLIKYRHPPNWTYPDEVIF